MLRISLIISSSVALFGCDDGGEALYALSSGLAQAYAQPAQYPYSATQTYTPTMSPPPYRPSPVQDYSNPIAPVSPYFDGSTPSTSVDVSYPVQEQIPPPTINNSPENSCQGQYKATIGNVIEKPTSGEANRRAVC